MAFSNSLNRAGGGGSVKPRTASVDDTATGNVYHLRAGLTAPVTWSKLSGNANISVAAGGAVSVVAALAAGVSQSAVVRGVSGTEAVEFGLTLTGRTPAPGPDPEPEPGDVGGLTPTVFSLPPAVHFHPHTAAVTLDEAGRVIAANDLMGLANAISTAGPVRMVDALGRKFWRFSRENWLNIAETFSAGLRNFSVFAVVRSHSSLTNNLILRLGQQGGTVASGGLDVSSQGGSISAIRLGGRALTAASANWPRMIVGSDLSVIGGCARTGSGTTADTGNLCFVNGAESANGQSGVGTSYAGAVIGGVSTSSYQYDVYEIALYATGISDADGRAAHAAMVNNWQIAPVTRQILIEGDSTIAGTSAINSGLLAGMAVSAPGLVPDGTRVVTIAGSGSYLAHYASRRDGANGWASALLAENIVVLMTGTNDMGGQSMTVQETYDGIVSYVKTNAALGVKAVVCINIAGSPDVMTLRERLALPQFITDCEAGEGQQFAGMVKTAPVNLIEHDGEPRFLDMGDRQNATYYLGDQIHLTGLGATILGNGGDTPQYGIAGAVF